MQIERLVYMANQIGKYFAAQGEAATIAGVADHLKRFWDPRMRAAIIAHVAADGAGLDDAVKRAVLTLKA